ncbi:MAG: PAS domain S-box protein, partial [Planctomycetes bacterium]|nr:PAS domain S-box protein [Planctomycetota bacterium]
NRYICKDGSYKWLEWRATAADEKGVVYAAATDITERKKAEEAYRSLVDHSLQGLAIFQDGRVVFANQAMADITGYTVEEMLALSSEQVLAFVHPDDHEFVWNRYRDRLNGEELPERYEFRGIRKDGSMCWVEIHASQIEYQGKPAIQAAYVDITEERRAREALRETENSFHTSVENMLDCFGIYSAIRDESGHIVDFRIDYVNAAACASNFMTKNEQIGKRLCELLPAHRETGLFDEYCQVVETGKPIEKESLIFGDVYKKKYLIRAFDIRAVKLGDGFTAAWRDVTERKQAEDNLRESEEHYRMLTETMNDGLGQVDETGTYVYVNNKFGEMLGYSPDEMVGRHWTAFFDKNAQKITNEQLTKRRKGISKPYELENTRKDGQKIFIHISPQGIFDAEGKFKGSFAIMTDITGRKRAEEQIEKLAKFPAEDPNPVLRISGHGTVIYANKASLPLLKVWRCRVGQSLPNPWHEFVLDALSSGQNQRTEAQCDERIFSLTFTPIVKANYVNIYGLDITDRKGMEEKLRESEEQFRQFFENEPEYCYMISAEAVILDVNKAALDILGYEKSRLVGQPLEVIYAPESQSKMKQLFKKWRKSGTLRDEEMVIVTKKGDRRIVLLSASIVRDKDGKVLHSMSVQRDITERKKAEERLLEHQAKLKAMASEMLLTEERERQRLAVGLHDEVCQKLVFTKLALESSMQLVSDSKVLASLRIACGAIGETIEQADSLTFELSNPVLRQLGFVIALEKYLTEEIRQKHGIAFELEGDEQLSALPDEIKNCLFRVTRELLTNVVKHAHARKIRVSVRKACGQIRVSVQDDGAGFEESQAGSKVSQTTRFGLFSIREQLEYLGGYLEIESEPGRGTTVTAVVPIRK